MDFVCIFYGYFFSQVGTTKSVEWLYCKVLLKIFFYISRFQKSKVSFKNWNLKNESILFFFNSPLKKLFYVIYVNSQNIVQRRFFTIKNWSKAYFFLLHKFCKRSYSWVTYIKLLKKVSQTSRVHLTSFLRITDYFA